MLGKNSFRKFVTIITVAAVWCLYSMVAFAMPNDTTGEITVTGQVTVNGQTAVSNSTIMSGATIVSGADSSAVISLGKTGRIEILANSNLTLRFADNSIVGILSSGKAHVSNSTGVATTVTTKDTTVIADTGQADNFIVEVECSHTHVDTNTGSVTMREGTNDKQVVAGTSATAGNLTQTGCPPCYRQSAPNVAVTGMPWLLWLAIGGAVGAVIIGTRSGDTTAGGGTVVISPTR